MDNEKKFHLNQKNKSSEKIIEHSTTDVIQFLQLFKLMGTKIRENLNDKTKD